MIFKNEQKNCQQIFSEKKKIANKFFLNQNSSE